MAAGAGIEARDLVFVLIGEQLEPVARHRLGEAGPAGRLVPPRRLGLAHQRLVAAAAAAPLVAGPELLPIGPDPRQRPRRARLLRLRPGSHRPAPPCPICLPPPAPVAAAH